MTSSQMAEVVKCECEGRVVSLFIVSELSSPDCGGGAGGIEWHCLSATKTPRVLVIDIDWLVGLSQ